MVDSYLDTNLQFDLTQDLLNLIDEDIKQLALRNEVLKQKNTELANKLIAVDDINLKYETQLQQFTDRYLEISEQFSKLNMQLLKQFQSSTKLKICYPTYLQGIYRKLVHDQCDELDLKHFSHGNGKKRFLQVEKKSLVKEENEKDYLIKKEKDLKDQLSHKIKQNHQIQQQNFKQNLESFQDVPDPIREIQIISINPLENQTVSLEIRVLLPEDNGSKIQSIISHDQYSGIITEFDINQQIILNVQANQICSYGFSSKNQQGESDLSQYFQFKIPEPQRGTLFVTGRCEKNQLGVENLTQEDQQYINQMQGPKMVSKRFLKCQKFSQIVNSFCSNQTSLMLNDYGIIIKIIIIYLTYLRMNYLKFLHF